MFDKTYRISAILLPRLPMTHPIKSLGTVIDIVSVFELEFWFLCSPLPFRFWRLPVLNWLPANAAKAEI